MATSLFDSQAYYTFSNTQLSDSTISCGENFDTKGAIKMTQQGSLSSENWQLWYQEGRYFVRNHDYGANWQLGVSQSSLYVPLLLPASGDLTQQWEVTSLPGGALVLTSLAFAKSNNLSDTSGQLILAIAPQTTNIVMETTQGQSGAQWLIDINESAGHASVDMLKNLTDIQNPQIPVTTSTTSSSTHVQTSKSTSTPTTLPSTTLPASSTANSSSSGSLSSTSSPSSTGSSSVTNHSSNHTLSGGTIAGIVIGSLAGLLLIIALLTLAYRRQRRRRLEATGPRQAPVVEAASQQKYR